jgi:CDP-2,3-bis-(O-geranylgeranyl)-sn-glycerol synthase
MDYTIIVQAFWLVIPIYIANASAVIVGGGLPIDLNKKYRDGKRVLGDGKTWRGLLSGTFIGMTAGFGLSIVGTYINTSEYGYLNVNTFEGYPFMIPILLSLCGGALLGDIIESFFKRRIGKDRGEDWYIFDQLDFIIGALVFSFSMSVVLVLIGATPFNWFLETISLWHILILLITTPFIHISANLINKRIRSTQTKTYKS